MDLKTAAEIKELRSLVQGYEERIARLEKIIADLPHEPLHMPDAPKEYRRGR